MTPAPPAARRLPLLGCALAVVALTLPACGGGATDESGPGAATAVERGRQPRAGSGAEACPPEVDALLEALRALHKQLAIGLSYEQYAAKLEGPRERYDEIRVGRLAIDCLASTGTPGEQALNEYIDAANAWGECLADAACTTAAIEPALQRRWRLASRALSETR